MTEVECDRTPIVSDLDKPNTESLPHFIDYRFTLFGTFTS
jgi:hypothetical protein